MAVMVYVVGREVRLGRLPKKPGGCVQWVLITLFLVLYMSTLILSTTVTGGDS